MIKRMKSTTIKAKPPPAPNPAPYAISNNPLFKGLLYPMESGGMCMGNHLEQARFRH